MTNSEIMRVLKIWGRDLDIAKMLDGKIRIAVFAGFYSEIESTERFDSLEEGLDTIYNRLSWEIYNIMEHWYALKELGMDLEPH